MSKPGVFVVIDGTDGSGKGTQTALIIERLTAEGQRVKMVDFPQYGNGSAFFVEKYLKYARIVVHQLLLTFLVLSTALYLTRRGRLS